jgi:glyoxylate reductase
VNTARGEVIDETRSPACWRPRSSAAPASTCSSTSRRSIRVLLRAKRAVLLPHMGSATIEGRVDMGEKVIINIKTWVDGHKPPDRVLPSML